MPSRVLSCFIFICLAIAAQSIPLNCDDVAVKGFAPVPVLSQDDVAPIPTTVEVSSAPVGVLYSPATRASQGWRWDWEWSGCKHALDSLGVEYEILSPEDIEGWSGRLLILPNVRNLSSQTVASIQAKEVKVLATYMSSYRSESNEPWEGNNFALSEVLGVDFKGWVGGGERAERLRLSDSLGGKELPLGRGFSMLVDPKEGARVLASWPGGEAAIVESTRGIYVGEDLFCPENSDSKPVLQLVGTLLNRLEKNVAGAPQRMTFSETPEPPATSLSESGRTVRVGLGQLEGETVLRAPESLSVNGDSKLKFHRWLKGSAVEVIGQPYVEVLRLRENGTYRWSAYRGTLRITKDGDLTNVLDFEEYLAGVVPGEVPSYFPEESLKAMSVVARTYGLSQLGRHQTYDVCDTVHCQVYRGLGKESKSTNLAVAATSGELLTFEGQPVNALFHAVCGGTTAASVEAWPGGADKPYLSSRDDGTYCAHSGRYRWQQEYSQSELTATLRTALEATRGSEYRGLSTLQDMRVEERGPSGRVRVLSIESPELTYQIKGDAIRWLFSGGRISTAGLQSTLFEVEKKEDGYVIKGGGWGHGVGLCQQGASGRAKAGQSYQQILHHYYPETALLALREWERRTAETTVVSGARAY
jgi:stage II sporulation protein D